MISIFQRSNREEAHSASTGTTGGLGFLAYLKVALIGVPGQVPKSLKKKVAFFGRYASIKQHLKRSTGCSHHECT